MYLGLRGIVSLFSCLSSCSWNKITSYILILNSSLKPYKDEFSIYTTTFCCLYSLSDCLLVWLLQGKTIFVFFCIVKICRILKQYKDSSDDVNIYARTSHKRWKHSFLFFVFVYSILTEAWLLTYDDILVSLDFLFSSCNSRMTAYNV